MSSYEVEHNIPSQPPTSSPPPRRPDFASFYARLTQIDTSTTNNPHAVPIPADVSAANRLAAEAYQLMRAGDDGRQDELLGGMVAELMRGMEEPVRKVEGVGDGFLDELERVPIKSLKPKDICPICANPFLDDPYPLIVRLPCHPSHIYDLECIAPWLKLHATCPLDRKDLLQGKRKREEEERRRGKEQGDKEEEEEDGDEVGMYA